MKKVILCGFVNAIAALNVNAIDIDIESSVKDFEKNGDWNSFTITDPNFGSVVSTRATTMNPSTKITFAVNFSTREKCQPFIELIYPLDQMNSEDIHNDIFGNIQIDAKPYLRVEAEEVIEKDANFAFIGFDGENITKNLKGGKVVTANFRRYGVAEFTLSGAKSSVEKAYSTCKNFAF